MSDAPSPVSQESEAIKRERMIAQLNRSGATIPFAETITASSSEPDEEPESPSPTPEPAGSDPDDDPGEENPVERAIKDTAFFIKTIDNYLKILHSTDQKLLTALSVNQESLAQLQLLAAKKTVESLPTPAPVKKQIPLLHWFVAAAVCFGIGSFIVSRTLLTLERKLENDYRAKIAGIESLTQDNRKTLQLLAEMGIKLELRTDAHGAGYYLLFKGAQQIEPGLNSPEGPNVRFYPNK